MTPGPPALTLLGNAQLAESAQRTAAAAGLTVVRASHPSRQNWAAAAAVILDLDFARQCTSVGVARRGGVVLVSTGDLVSEVWSAALDVGAQNVYSLPGQEAELVNVLSELAESFEAGDQGRRHSRSGPLIAVTGGRGGGGASVFAAALAQCAGEALLVDLDACAGGIDLLMGGESAPGLRWPDLSVRGGRLSWAAVRDALPRRDRVTMLSATRAYCDIDAGAAVAVVDAGRRGGSTVICDVPRLFGPAATAILESADLVVVVTSCDVRGIAATAAMAGVLRTVNPHVGLVVRGPAPGGMRAAEVADIASLPLLAAMRPEASLDQRLEQGGLRLGRRSPLAAAARTVLSVLEHRSGVIAA